MKRSFYSFQNQLKREVRDKKVERKDSNLEITTQPAVANSAAALPQVLLPLLFLLLNVPFFNFPFQPPFTQNDNVSTNGVLKLSLSPS